MVSSLNRLALAAFVVAITIPSFASADEVDRCVAASERGQKERRAGNLSEARTTFMQCAADKCPAVVKSACAEWLAQVNAALPSIIVVATDPEKKDIVDAKISIDGKPAALGRAVPLDPGAHSITVDAEGFQSMSQSIVARETEHNRAINFTLVRKAAVDTTEPKPPPTESSGIRPITWIGGGLTVVALGSFAIFGLRGRGLAADLRETCKPTCSATERDEAKASYIAADISLIAAVIFGGFTVYTYLAGRDAKP